MSMIMWAPLALFSLVTLVLVYFYLRYFRLLAFYKKSTKEVSIEHPVSVVVCARDAADDLEENLPGLLAQSYKTTHEIVVVNDNSQDDTKYLLEGLYRDFKQLHLVELKQEAMHIPGKKFPLSMGIKAARHEVLLLTDADCIPASEKWIQKMQDAFSNGIEIVLGYGAYKKKRGLLNWIVRLDTFHTALQYLSAALAGKAYMGVGRNLAYKRELFFRQKGFAAHHHLPGGDDDLFVNGCANNQNTAIVIDREAFTYSTPPSSWSEWFAQKERHNSTGKYYKGSDKWRLGIYMISHFLFYPMLVISWLTFDWRWVLGILIFKYLVQFLVFFKSMKKLGEADLFPLIILWDIWMFFYYLLFMSAIWKKPKTQWN
jgi:glycosyltransferase involved in cell wall biosynthesis